MKPIIKLRGLDVWSSFNMLIIHDRVKYMIDMFNDTIGELYDIVTHDFKGKEVVVPIEFFCNKIEANDIHMKFI